MRKLVAPKSKFGFDVMVSVGKSLFLRCRGEKEIQHKLIERNIPISIREIGYLGKKFIIYLALVHKECQGRIKQLMALRGGYVLHLDGTCEGDSPHLMSALDSISDIVIDNVKLPSENSDQIIPFLKQIKKVYGNPIAGVHDMGKGILKAIKDVFPEIADFICHFHFLKDIGNDLFGSEYAMLRKALTKSRVRSKLRKNLKTLTEEIDADTKLAKCRDLYLQQQLKGKVSKSLPAAVAAYTWIHWILDSKRELSGYGFPFDRDHYVFYQRLQTVKKAFEILPAKIKKDSRIFQLNSILILVLNDQNLKKTVTMLQEKVSMFDQLREAMQIALPEGKKGLNDDGNDVDIKTIKEKVTDFRNSKKVKKAAEKNVGYKKMLKQIDKYWDKLFADPITVINSDGEKIIIQPQRTNNILERLFRSIKRAFRKRSGNKSLNRTLKALLSNTPLVQNLQHPEYMKVLLN
ncbi:MAG: transposase, partial [Deltaproteobacteria bacterium]|nr:transposase [Deltaproteobacteria bacterium]